MGTTFSPKPQLVVKHLTKSFGDSPILRDITFQVNVGETMLLLGANGSGKTTLLKILGRHWTAEKGVVDGGGTVLVMPEERGFFEFCTVKENLLAFCSEESLHEFPFQSLMEKKFYQLSKAQKLALHLTRGFARGRGKTVILDEPFAHLDAGARQWLAIQVESHAKTGGSVIVSAQEAGQCPLTSGFSKTLQDGELR